jgi:hypothetical protein
LAVLEEDHYLRRNERDTKRVWGTWRLRIGQRRMKRWKKDMEGREEAFIRAKDDKLSGDAFNVGTVPRSDPAT